MSAPPTTRTDLTLSQAIRAGAQAYPEREALVMGDVRLTYRQLSQQVDALAAGLLELGLGPGDKIAAILPTCPEGVVALIAPGAIGAVAVPLNPALRSHEVRHILADSGAKALITVAEMFGHDYLQMIAAVRPALPALRHVIIRDGASPAARPAAGDLFAWSDVVARGRVTGWGESGTDPAATACLIYTSGTTGTPKGAAHSHRNLLLLSSVVEEMLGAEVWEVNLNPFPLFHIGGIGLALITLYIGGKVVLLERFRPQQALQAVATERVTFIGGAPTMYQAMLAFPGSERYDLSSLRMIAASAAPVPPALLKALRDRAKCAVLNGYGATEAGLISVTSHTDPEELQLTTVGRPGKGVEVRIVDEHRRDVPLGQPGEIATRAPFIMQGYHNRPQETAEVMDEAGWYYTGDIGSLDAQGYLRIFDRKRDMIIRGGENVYPAEIEWFLTSHPAVQMAAVIGLPGQIGGEKVRAYVQPKEGAQVTPTDLLNHCRGRIAAFKVPDEFHIVTELPLTPTRKVQKFKLREMALQEN
jgi:acyl-CoA synthetase (AMP-forming)/AMP-acid ligase II